jgi:hypothetical protein
MSIIQTKKSVRNHLVCVLCEVKLSGEPAGMPERG